MNSNNFINNNSSITNNDSNNTSSNSHQNKINHLTETKQQEYYFNLLINSIDSLFSSNEITLNYLNSKTEIKPIKNDSNKELNDYHKSCENKYCNNVILNPSKIIHTKILSYKPKEIWLCESCYNAFLKNNYCYYCNTIYKDEYSDNKSWIECDFCHVWQHIQCEEKKGKYKNIEKLINNKEFKYMCPFCRNKKDNQKKEYIIIYQSLLKKKKHFEHEINGNKTNSENKNKKKIFDLRNIQCDDINELVCDFQEIYKINELENSK